MIDFETSFMSESRRSCVILLLVGGASVVRQRPLQFCRGELEGCQIRVTRWNDASVCPQHFGPVVIFGRLERSFLYALKLIYGLESKKVRKQSNSFAS